jgi:hypothetical protein
MPLTVSQLISEIAPQRVSQDGVISSQCPPWPADVFAICASLLEKSGAYCGIGTFSPPIAANFKTWPEEIQQIAEVWRVYWANYRQAPPAVQERWQIVQQSREVLVQDVGGRPAEKQTSRPLLHALLELTAIADESLCNAGLIPIGLRPGTDSMALFKFWLHADRLLQPQEARMGSTLCQEIHPSRARVLPKSQTPYMGLSIRSWSHHLALCPNMDVLVSWYGYGAIDFGNTSFCNLLLIPWPFEIRPNQFESLLKPKQRAEVKGVPPHVNWFRFRPGEETAVYIVSMVERLLEQARNAVGPVHVVVLPEVALRRDQFDELSRYLTNREITLISGVAEQAEPGSKLEKNYVAVSLPMPKPYGPITFYQGKHHRWQLDRNQIVRYGLSSALDPEGIWWEGIRIEEHAISFIRFRQWLSTCVLVCEDLARLEPVGLYVRTVAPDLVIALLLDGPQVQRRWPAYYATVLAQDPGSSVLTLTSLGMTKLSRAEAGYGAESDPVIALWRDAYNNKPVEVRLPRGGQAAVLSLNRRRVEEWTADGRGHFAANNPGAPVFGGINFL